MKSCIVTENLDHARFIRDGLFPETPSEITVSIYSYTTVLGATLYEVILSAPMITVSRMGKSAMICVTDAYAVNKAVQLDTGTFKSITVY